MNAPVAVCLAGGVLLWGVASGGRAAEEPPKNAPAAGAPAVSAPSDSAPSVPVPSVPVPSAAGGAATPAAGRPGWGGPPWAGRGPWRGGRGADAQFEADRQQFHFLLEHHGQVRRSVTSLSDGVETLTESDDPAVAQAIREHVAAMQRRVEGGRPIHRRDPLFDALFSRADRIRMEVTPTAAGVKVVERSADPATAALIRAHAEVVSLFVRHGFAEARQNHAVPPEAIRKTP